MRLQTLFESTGDVWVIVLDLNNGQFADDDVFENMDLFSSETSCVDKIFEHFEKAFIEDGEEDSISELHKMRRRNNTVEKALTLIDAFSSLEHLQDVLLVKKMRVN